MNGQKGSELSPHGVPVAKVVPARGQLKMLADHMARSHTTNAAFTTMGEVDATVFDTYRRELVKKVEDKTGVHITFTHLIVKILGLSLQEHPIINSTLADDKIMILADINIGVGGCGDTYSLR